MGLQIVVPSLGRAGSVKTHSCVDNFILCVYEEEADKYREHNPNTEIIIAKCKRGLKYKRQFIYEHFGDVFMIDDDVSHMYRVYSTKRPLKVDKETARAIIENTYQSAKEFGAKLFGFASFVKTLMFRANAPFTFTGFINGCAMGIMKDPNLNFGINESLNMNDDFFVSMINAYHNRFFFKDRRFCIASEKGTFTTIGGTSNVRTLEREKQDIIMLRKLFGNAVEFKKTKGVNATHPYQRQVNIKF